MISGIIMFVLGYFAHKYQDNLISTAKTVVGKIKEAFNKA